MMQYVVVEVSDDGEVQGVTGLFPDKASALRSARRLWLDWAEELGLKHDCVESHVQDSDKACGVFWTDQATVYSFEVAEFTSVDPKFLTP